MAVKVAGGQRLTALGCQNGFLKCALVDLSSGSKLRNVGSNRLLTSAIMRIDSILIVECSVSIVMTSANMLYD